MNILDLVEIFESVMQKTMDTADSDNEERGCTIVLPNMDDGQAHYYDETLKGQTLKIPNDGLAALLKAMRGKKSKKTRKTDRKKISNKAASKTEKPIPEQISKMKALYQYGDGSFQQLCKNFYVQGKFMEDYEDDAPWHGSYYEYWPSYHKLSVNQLRGYFTWRTELRKGKYQKHCDAFSYIYIFELINKIGTASAEESLHKMEEFEKGYIEAGFGTEYMQETLRQCMFDFAIVNGMAPEIACRYADHKMLERDAKIEILHHPEQYSDQEVFEALCMFSGRTIPKSTVLQKEREAGISLFAAVWRLASVQYRQNRKTLFGFCFGRRETHYWNPLNNVLYYEKPTQETVTYTLNPCRKYSRKGNTWYEHNYTQWYLGQKNVADLLHEADRQLRLYLNTGRPLKKRTEEAWASPYVDAVIEADKQAKIEAARTKIMINFSSLDKIRQEALETQGSLLTEEEKQAVAKHAEISKSTSSPEYAQNTQSSSSVDRIVRKNAAENKHTITGSTEGKITATQKDTAQAATKSSNNAATDEQTNSPESLALHQTAAETTGKESVLNTGETAAASASLSAVRLSSAAVSLDNMQIQLLQMLLRGEPVREFIAEQHGMPNVIADSINEALFDSIGDTTVECGGETITLVEDYREDIAGLLEEAEMSLTSAYRR